MLQSPNYIHFRNQWHILGLDSAGKWPDKKSFLKLFNKLNDSPVNADFDKFSYETEPCQCDMVKLRGSPPEKGQAFTKFLCRSNQITLVEEWAETTTDEFKDRFVGILDKWFSMFPNTALIAQKCCLRALVQPANFNDARSFLGDRIMKIGSPMENTFKGMPFKVGFTFTCLRESKGYNLFIDTTVNTWRDDKSIWVQVEGIYPMEKPINATNTEIAKFPFEDCKSFLESEVISFLSQYDKSD